MKRLFVASLAPVFAACASHPPQDAPAHAMASEKTPVAHNPVIAAPALKPGIAEANVTEPSRTAVEDKRVMAPVLAAAPGLADAPQFTPEVMENFMRDLRRHGVSRAEAGAYEIEAELVELQQPFAGLDMTVTAIVAYKVKNKNTSIFHQETIETAYTAKAGDALAGVERLRLAKDGAVRRNVAMFLETFDAAIMAPAAP